MSADYFYDFEQILFKEGIMKEYVLITGASSGIGESLAESFAEDSYSLILLARREDKLKLVKEKCLTLNPNIKVHTLKADVRSEEELEKVNNFIKENNINLKIVVANAGFGVAGKARKLCLEDYKNQFETNIYGVLRTFYSFKDDLIKSKGHFAILGSVSSYYSSPNLTPYSMSKFAVRAFAEGITPEMKEVGVKCTLICPGFVESEIRHVNNKGKYNPKSKDPVPNWLIMDTKKAAHKMKKAILKNKKEVIITAHGKVIVWLKRHFPIILEILGI